MRSLRLRRFRSLQLGEGAVGQQVKLRREGSGVRLESRQVVRRDRRCRRHGDRKGIARLARDAEFVVQVRSRSPASLADKADSIVLLNARAALYCNAA